MPNVRRDHERGNYALRIMRLIPCPKCSEDSGFLRPPVIDNVFITGDKKATCRTCGLNFDFHYGQTPEEEELKLAIYEGCDQNITLIKALKDQFLGDENPFGKYYNFAVWLQYGEAFPPKKPVVLTLWEPFASLYAAGLKKIETRPRATSFAGTMMIHTAKNPPKEALKLAETEPFASALQSIGISDFKNGYLIGAVDQCICIKIIDPSIAKTMKTELDACKVIVPPPDPEFSFGDYRPNRFAWFGRNHRQLEEPIEYTNGQGYYLKLRENLDYSTFKFKAK